MAIQDSSSAAAGLELADQGPFVFWGAPAQLRGTVGIRNRSTEKVKVRGMPLETGAVRGLGGQPVIVSLFARLPPDSQANMSASLALDPSTPPGEYDGYVTLGESRRSVRLLVTEHVDVRVHPRQAFIQTDGVLEFTREFVFENAGNVPVSLGGDCLVPLIDTLETRTALRYGLAEACKKDKSDDVLKAVLCAWADQQPGPVSVRREPVTLDPGVVRPVKAVFTLPKDIRSFRKYVLHMLVYTAAIRVDVTTGKIP
jgi:hypothetical protein